METRTLERSSWGVIEGWSWAGTNDSFRGISHTSGKAMTTPLVSVVISSYNHAAFVTDAIKSVLNQTYGHVELIVTDDGSTDGSADLIEPLHQEHGFTFIRQNNHGLSWSLNNMISHFAKGEYIALLGSDDMMMPDRLALQVDFMETHPEYGATGGNVIKIDHVGTPANRQKKKEATRLDFDSIFHRNGHIPTPTAMFRKSAFVEVGGFNERLALEDLDFWLRMTHAGYPIYMMGDVLSKYRLHEGSAHYDVKMMMESIEKTYEPFKKHPEYQKVMQDHYSSKLLRAAKVDKAYAKVLLRKSRFMHKPLKYLKALILVSVASSPSSPT
jgi:alpha-1,3-rhamnosyltransferase